MSEQTSLEAFDALQDSGVIDDQLASAQDN